MQEIENSISKFGWQVAPVPDDANELILLNQKGIKQGKVKIKGFWFTLYNAQNEKIQQGYKCVGDCLYFALKDYFHAKELKTA